VNVDDGVGGGGGAGFGSEVVSEELIKVRGAMCESRGGGRVGKL